MIRVTNNSHSRRGVRVPPGVIAFALIVAVAGAVTFVASRSYTTSPPSVLSGPLGPLDAPTLERPLAPEAVKVTLAQASRKLGGPVTLPDSPIVKASDAGAVWAASFNAGKPDAEVAIAVTFPARDLIIRYGRPAMADPLSTYESAMQDTPGSKVIYLRAGTPAMAIAALPDSSGWGSIEFVSGGTVIVVMGHDDEATLERVANSILARGAAS